MNSVPLVILWCFMVLGTLWMTLIVYYHAPWPSVRIALTLLPVGFLVTSLAVPSLIVWSLTAWFGMLLLILAWWCSLRPKADRDWAPGMEVLPRPRVDGERIHISHFRNFDYDSAGQAIPRYEERTFDLTKLRSLDYLLSHCLGPAIAHSLVSSGFDDGQYLALSVEARRRRGQRYSPLAGLFRSYELMYVLGYEHDGVRLRTEVRRERIYLYRVHIPTDNIKLLLLDYLERAEQLYHRPQWYNSLFSNCTTNLFFHSHRRVQWWLKPGIYLNGLSDRMLYRLGALSNNVPFRELQSRSAIYKLSTPPGNSQEFSQGIRAEII